MFYIKSKSGRTIGHIAKAGNDLGYIATCYGVGDRFFSDPHQCEKYIRTRTDRI